MLLIFGYGLRLEIFLDRVYWPACWPKQHQIWIWTGTLDLLQKLLKIENTLLSSFRDKVLEWDIYFEPWVFILHAPTRHEYDLRQSTWVYHLIWALIGKKCNKVKNLSYNRRIDSEALNYGCGDIAPCDQGGIIKSLFGNAQHLSNISPERAWYAES